MRYKEVFLLRVFPGSSFSCFFIEKSIPMEQLRTTNYQFRIF